MSNCEYLGSLELDGNGIVRVRRPQIQPPPRRAEQRVTVPASVARAIRQNRARLARVLGDSMQPGILDNDSVVISTIRWPRHGDVVAVRLTAPHPVYGNIEACLWRLQEKRGRAYLTKDNERYRDSPSVTASDILGVVTRVLPRERRDELENYERVQLDKALFREFKWGDPPPDLGFFRDAETAEFRSVVEIPPSELIAGRLPWGLFRATAIAGHPQVGITAGDTLTIEPTIQSHVGVIAIKRNDAGETIVGRLQLEGFGTRKVGEFFVDLADRRVMVTRDTLPLWHTIGLVRHVESRKRRASTRALKIVAE